MHHHVTDGFWLPAERWQSGIAFSAAQLLEVAVMLLGASSTKETKSYLRPARSESTSETRLPAHGCDKLGTAAQITSVSRNRVKPSAKKYSALQKTLSGI
jgi:hypothetical protein